jgi:hypothetical protein
MMSIFHEIIVGVFKGLTLIKIGVAVFMVVGLSLIAEKVSTRFAGLVSGFPLGAAISLFFIGYEIEPSFAARSALFTILGLIGTMAFAFGYYATSFALRGRSGIIAAMISSIGGILFYFAAAYPLKYLNIGLIGAVLTSSAAIVGFTYLFKNLKNIPIKKPLRSSFGLLLLRSLFAAAVITLITASARLVGSDWAGLLAAFPITMLPFVFIIHATYHAEHVWAILKNVPMGLGAIVVYGFVIALSYPRHGIWLGTLEGYLAAATYLLLLNLPIILRKEP